MLGGQAFGPGFDSRRLHPSRNLRSKFLPRLGHRLAWTGVDAYRVALELLRMVYGTAIRDAEQRQQAQERGA